MSSNVDLNANMNGAKGIQSTSTCDSQNNVTRNDVNLSNAPSSSIRDNSMYLF